MELRSAAGFGHLVHGDGVAQVCEISIFEYG